MADSERKPLSRTPYELVDISYRYAQGITEGHKHQQDYGTGELYSPVEVHTVTMIEENPGITTTEIAERTLRTKGAVSQIIARLEQKELIRREKNPDNARQIFLYVTEKGQELSLKHKQVDEQLFGRTLEKLMEIYGRESVENFFRIMEYLTAPNDCEE